MSDSISIPGVSSKYNTEKIIENLMKVERIPLQRMETEVKEYQSKKTVYREINQKINKFSESAKRLYGLDNPFQDRIAKSSDEDILTALATRSAVEETKNIIVKQDAQTDRFMSKSLKKDFQVPQGRYTFTVGDKSLGFQFSGGSVRKFVDAVNKKGRDIIKASLVRDSADTNILVIESLISGKKNKLEFRDTAANFGLEAGILEKTQSLSREISLSEARIRPWTTALSQEDFSVTNGTLVLEPGAELSLPLSPPLPIQKNLVLEMDVNVIDLAEKQQAAVQPPPGPDIPDSGELEYKGVRIKNNPAQISLPEWQPPAPPQKTEDMSVLFLNDGQKITKLPQLSSAGKQKIRVSLKDYVDQLQSLNLRNRNTFKRIELSNIKIVDPDARGDYRPAHPISQAQDAVLILDGIQVTRDSNTIDDLIPGVTLNLLGKSDKPINLDITPDRDGIKNSLIHFVGYYNQLIAEIQILTRDNPDILSEIDYLSEEEKKQKKEQLGIFKGDITLMQLQNRLQEIMMNPYPKREGSAISMLAQIGISTNTRISGGVDFTKLRGYLEVDEEVLDSKLSSSLPQIKDLFGMDTNDDLLIDSGLGFTAEQYGKAYYQKGGIIDNRLRNIDSRLSHLDNDIVNYKRKLADKEQELRRKYGMMEATLGELEKSSKALDNFNKSNSK